MYTYPFKESKSLGRYNTHFKKENGMAMLTLNEIQFRTKKIIKDKEISHNDKTSICQGDTSFSNSYAQNNRAGES